MFSPIVVFVTLFMIVQVMASPLLLSHAVERRMTGQLQEFPVYVKRQIPDEIPTKSPDGVIIPYEKRQIPAEIPTKSPNGVIEPY